VPNGTERRFKAHKDSFELEPNYTLFVAALPDIYVDVACIDGPAFDRFETAS